MVCVPGASPANTLGLVHAANAPLSRLHSKPATSVAVLENPIVAVVPLTVALSIDTLGAVSSIV